MSLSRRSDMSLGRRMAFAEAVADALYEGARFSVDDEAPTDVDVRYVDADDIYVEVTFPSKEVFRLQVVGPV